MLSGVHATGASPLAAQARPVARAALPPCCSRIHPSCSIRQLSSTRRQGLPAKLLGVTQPTTWASHRNGRRTLQVCAAWGDPIEWQPAEVINSEPAAEGMQRLLVDTGAVAEKYVVPGQYIQMRIGEGSPGFYAIASPPDPNNLGVVELLIKAIPESASEQLAATKPGDAVEVSPVMGNGFKVGQLPVADFDTLLLFATGSGIAPVKALIESQDLQLSERASVKLYYGTRAQTTTPFQEAAAGWAAAGVELVNVYSSDKKGYVQDIFAKEPSFVDGSRVGAVLCGQKQMAEQITQTLMERGVDKERILTNF